MTLPFDKCNCACPRLGAPSHSSYSLSDSPVLPLAAKGHLSTLHSTSPPATWCNAQPLPIETPTASESGLAYVTSSTKLLIIYPHSKILLVLTHCLPHSCSTKPRLWLTTLTSHPPVHTAIGTFLSSTLVVNIDYHIMDRHDSGKPGCDSEHVLDKTVSNAAKADFEGACASPAANRPYGHNEVIDEEPEVQKQAGQGCEKEQAKCSSPASLSTVSASLSTVSASSESQKQGVSETETSNARVVTYATETACGCVTLRNFSEFALHIKNLRCRLCRELRFSSELDICTMFQNWMDETVDTLSCIVKCSTCGLNSCIACKPESYSKLSKIKIVQEEQSVTWCCVAGRLYLIWMLLCGFDQHLSGSGKMDKTAEPANFDRNPKHSHHGKAVKKNTYGTCIGYEDALSHLHGDTDAAYDESEHLEPPDEISSLEHYENWSKQMKKFGFFQIADHPPEPGHFQSQANSPSSPRKDEVSISNARKAEASEDKFASLILGFLTDLLPSLEINTCFDRDPPVTVLEMLTTGRILHHCAGLLRNDSLADFTKRKNLYWSLFRFLKTLDSHPSTRKALFDARSTYPENVDFLALSFCTTVPILPPTESESPPPHRPDIQAPTPIQPVHPPSFVSQHSTMQGPPDHYPGPGDPPSASPVYNLHETMPSGSGASVPPQPFTNPPLGPVMGYFPCPPSSTGAPGTSVPRLPLPCINPSSVNPPGPVIGSFPCPPRSTGAPGTSQSFINSPPGPVIRTFSCPPNSNTRLATRGRGGSGSSSPSTRGGSSQAPYFTPSSRCRGTASPGHFSGGLPNLVLPESMHGGRGRGTSEQGSRGGRGDGAPGN